MSQSTGYYDVQEFVRETPQAWVLVIDNEEFTLPKSQVTYEEGDDEIEIPDWLAEDRGLL